MAPLAILFPAVFAVQELFDGISPTFSPKKMMVHPLQVDNDMFPTSLGRVVTEASVTPVVDKPSV